MTVIAIQDIGNIAIGLLTIAEFAMEKIPGLAELAGVDADEFADACAGPMVIIAGVVMLAQLVSTIMEKYHTLEFKSYRLFC